MCTFNREGSLYLAYSEKQHRPYITLYLESILHRNGPFYKRIMLYKGTILLRNYRKMTMLWSFSYNSFVKFCGKIFGSHNMTVLYPNPC